MNIVFLVLTLITFCMPMEIRIAAYFKQNRYPHLYLYAMTKANQDPSFLFGSNISLVFHPQSAEQGPNIIYAATAAPSVVAFMGTTASKLTSGIAAVLGILNKPMMGSGETSPVLSDKNQYPTFLRVCPPDNLQGVAIASIVKYYKFAYANVFYTNDIYGESLAKIVSKEIGSSVSIAVSRSYSSEAQQDQVNSIVQDIIDSGTKVNIFTSYINESTTTMLFDRIKEKGLLDGYAYIFSEHVASSILNQTQLFRGIVATFPGYNKTRYEEFKEVYNNKDLTLYKQYDAEFQVGTYWDTTGGWDPFIYDSIWAVILGVREMLKENKDPYDGVALHKKLKALTFDGLSGQVSFDANGDRIGGLYQILNFDGQDWIECGYWTQSTDVKIDVKWSSGKTDLPISRLILTKNDSDSSKKNTMLIVALCAALGVVIISLAILIIFLISYKRRKLVRTAPTGKVCLVFTDIQNSTELWLNYPQEMKIALGLHEDMMRRLIVQYKGYEVKTIGDSFMIAFKSTINAIQFCVEVQNSALYISWPPALASHPACSVVERNNKLIYRGLRDRMGIHVGDMDAQINHRLGNVDYFGTNVNIAARIEGLAQGGQILVSDDVKEIIKTLDNVSFSINSIGLCYLKGIGPYQIHEIRINGLEERIFPPPNAQAAALEPSVLEKVRGLKDGYQLCIKCSRMLKCPTCAYPIKAENPLQSQVRMASNGSITEFV